MPSLVKWMEIEQLETTFMGELLLPLVFHWFNSCQNSAIFPFGITYGPEQSSTRIGFTKSIFNIRDEGFEFYDLEQDPLERHLIEDHGLVLEFGTLADKNLK